MRMNRIQFQPGLSLSRFLDLYGDESKCEAALEASRWPDGFRCPRCGGHRHCSYRRKNTKVFQCSSCRVQTTLTEGTIFHSTKLALTVWFQAMYFLTQNKNNVSMLELTRLLGVCYRTAWRIKHKLMQVMHEREQNTKLSGRIEVDDSYLGGLFSNGRSGRGSENKIPFIAAIETNNQGHPLYAVFSPVATFSTEEVEDWAKKFLVTSSTVVSDGLHCFRGVKAAGCSHERYVVGRKSTSMECFKWVNTVLGNLKNAVTGTYHSFDFEKYSYRYLSEYQYRFNRRFDLSSILTRLLFAGARTGRRPEAYLRLAEDQR